MKVKSESEVAQSCPTPSDFMDCSLPGSSIHGIFQARVLEWVAVAFSKVRISIRRMVPSLSMSSFSIVQKSQEFVAVEVSADLQAES